jgi:hypothetical protein
MQQAQEEVAKLEVQGVAGGGMVTVTMNGKHMVKRIEIDDSLLGDDRDMLEDMIAAATNNAVEKVDQASKEKMASVTGGLNIPPGFNFNL